MIIIIIISRINYDFGSVRKFIVIFILSILFLFCPNLTVRLKKI